MARFRARPLLPLVLLLSLTAAAGLSLRERARGVLLSASSSSVGAAPSAKPLPHDAPALRRLLAAAPDNTAVMRALATAHLVRRRCSLPSIDLSQRSSIPSPVAASGRRRRAAQRHRRAVAAGARVSAWRPNRAGACFALASPRVASLAHPSPFSRRTWASSWPLATACPPTRLRRSCTSFSRRRRTAPRRKPPSGAAHAAVTTAALSVVLLTVWCGAGTATCTAGACRAQRLLQRCTTLPRLPRRSRRRRPPGRARRAARRPWSGCG